MHAQVLPATATQRLLFTFLPASIALKCALRAANRVSNRELPRSLLEFIQVSFMVSAGLFGKRRGERERVREERGSLGKT